MKLAELRRALGEATDHLNEVVDNETEFNKRMADIEALKGQIARAEKAEAAQAALALPHGTAVGLPEERAYAAAVDDSLRTVSADQVRSFNAHVRAARARNGMTAIDPTKHFRSLGEQLQAVQNHYATRGSSTDGRLTRAPTGAGEVDPTGGGFLVQVDFAEAIFALAHDMGELLGRVNKLPISANSNGIKVPGIDETSRATGSRWGGVQSYWADEGTQVTATKPKFRLVEFDVKKLFSVMYTSDELLQDSTALSAIAGQAFSEEVMFMTEDAIFEGSGAGQPLGILNSPALVTVAKDSGQAAATISKQNLDNMWSRLWARSRKNAVWLINQDIEPQLYNIFLPTGVSGTPGFMPAGGISGEPYSTLYGRPIIATEYNSTLGTTGDIALADLSQYTIVDKGGVRAETSMHVAFLTDQMVFRITYRVDGKPMWHSVLTPFKGSATKSPFIALATRS